MVVGTEENRSGIEPRSAIGEARERHQVRAAEARFPAEPTRDQAPVARVSVKLTAKPSMFVQARRLALWRDRGDVGGDQGVAGAEDVGAEPRHLIYLIYRKYLMYRNAGRTVLGVGPIALRLACVSPPPSCQLAARAG